MSAAPLLAFRVCGLAYALLIADVVEVAAMVEIIPLPDAPPGVLGLINRHGELLPLLDLRQALHHRSVPVDANTFFIVVQQHDQRMGLVVDDIDVVKYVPSGAFQPVPENRYVQAVVQHENQVLQVLDVQPLFAQVLKRTEQ